MDVKVHPCAETDMDDLTVTGFALSSRHVKPGFAFLAFQGEKNHGLDFAEQANQSGASVAISETASDQPLSMPLLEVPDLRQALRPPATAEQVPRRRRPFLPGRPVSPFMRFVEPSEEPVGRACARGP